MKPFNKIILMLLLSVITICSQNAFAIDLDDIKLFAKDLKEIAHLKNGKFFQGGIFGTLGVGIDQQFVITSFGESGGETLAAYCIGGQSAAPQIGVGVATQVGQTLSCKEPKEYAGGFLSIKVGGMLVIGGSLAYSFGVDVHGLINYMSAIRSKKSEEEQKELKNEMTELLEFITYHGTKDPSLSFAVMVIDNIFPSLITDEAREYAKSTLSELATTHMMTINDSGTYPSIGNALKNISTNLQKAYKDEDKIPPSRILTFLEGLTYFFTGCDSISVGLDVGLGTGGGISVQISDYIILSQIAQKDLNAIRPSNWLRKKNKKSKAEIVRFLKEITKDAIKCSNKAQANVIDYVGHMIRFKQGKNY